MNNWISRWQFNHPPPTLRVFFGDEPVAELSKIGGTKFLFRYLPAFHEKNLSPLPGIPASVEPLSFSQLPAFFQERLPDTRRPEIRALIAKNNIALDDELRLLAELGRRSITDGFVLKVA
jgi:HipA-like protein